MTREVEGTPPVSLVELVQTNRAAILGGWRERVAVLPAVDGHALAAEGGRVLDWLTRSIEAEGRRPEADDRRRESARELAQDESFDGPRFIAELALLTATIDAVTGASLDVRERATLHRVVDGAIAECLARAGDDVERIRKRLRLATDVTLVGCWEMDPLPGGVRVDPRSLELFGVGGGRVVTLLELTSQLHVEDRARLREGIADALKQGRAYVDECRTAQFDEGGPKWIAVAAEAHHSADARGPSLIGIVHDITASKRAAEEHARIVEELSRALHVSEMFVGILSHDLRNPLSAILGGAELLALGKPDEKSTRILARVVSSGRRMGRMIDQLLDFTRARLGEGIPLTRESADLSSLASEVVEELRAGSPSADLRYTRRGDSAGPWDGDRLCQVVSNLVGNAIQHGHEGGPIDIVLDGTQADGVTLTVANDGTIPADLLPVLFNPFRGTMQKRGKSSGLGLGLYVARQIALAHGGELSVASSESRTTFTLTLPRDTPSTFPSRQERVREEELAAFERMAAPPTVSVVTARLFGSTPLHERVPVEHSKIVVLYAALLEAALRRATFRGEGEGLAEELRAVAERLGSLGAGPREITDVHARALRLASRGASAAKTQALLVEGRLMALEVMGNLVGYYRRRSHGQGGAPSTPEGTP